MGSPERPDKGAAEADPATNATDAPAERFKLVARRLINVKPNELKDQQRLYENQKKQCP